MKAISPVFVVLSVLCSTLGPNVLANEQGETQRLELSKMGLMFVQQFPAYYDVFPVEQRPRGWAAVQTRCV